jgi:hypothetical protein
VIISKLANVIIKATLSHLLIIEFANLPIG